MELQHTLPGLYSKRYWYIGWWLPYRNIAGSQKDWQHPSKMYSHDTDHNSFRQHWTKMKIHIWKLKRQTKFSHIFYISAYRSTYVLFIAETLYGFIDFISKNTDLSNSHKNRLNHNCPNETNTTSSIWVPYCFFKKTFYCRFVIFYW